jgi:hypothetical protein
MVPIGIDNPLDLSGDGIGSLVPADPNVFAFAAVLGVTLAAGVPIDAFERIFYSIGRINPFL